MVLQEKAHSGSGCDLFSKHLALNITLFICIDVCISSVSSLCKGGYIQRF